MEHLKIVNSVTIEQLNPLNFALKNQYFSNLITSALIVIPTATKISMEPVTVTKGFLSKAYIQNKFDYSNRYNDLIKHASGLAIELTWEGFNVEVATQVAREVMNSTEILIKVLIDTEKNCISFYLEADKSIILQSTLDGVRTIWSK